MDAIALKGKIGEGRVVQELNKLDRTEYYILNDILIENKGYYAQIDHVLISKKAIYLIETKNWSGKLYGDQYSEQWKQYIRGIEYKQQNPVKQAWIHKRKFLEIFQSVIDQLEVKSIVVFLENVDITKVTTETNVLKINELVSFIESDVGYSYTIDDKAAQQIFIKVNDMNILDEEKRQAHIKNITGKTVFKSDLSKTKVEATNSSVKSSILEVLKSNLSRNKWHNSSTTDNYMEIKPCSLKKRTFAAVVDLLTYMIPGLFQFSISTSPNGEKIIMLLTVLILLVQGRFWAKGQSVGKKLAKIQTIDTRTQKPIRLFRMIIRELFGRLLLGIYTYGLVFLTMFFTKKKQTLYDLLLRCKVVKVPE